MKIRKVDFSPDEFLVGVAGMRAIDIAVYWVTCSLQISSGKAVNIADTRLFSIIDARAPDIKASLDRLVSAGKLQRVGDELTNNRVRKEIKSATKRIRTARENGPKGGRPRKNINEIKNPAGFDAGSGEEKLSPSPLSSPSPPHEEHPRSPQGGEAYSEEFERWWASFPNQTGKGAAWKAWEKAFIRVDLQTLIDAAKRYAQTKPDDRQWCNPSKWLRENRWEDAPPASTTAEPAEPEGDLRWRLRVQGFTKNGFWNRDLWGPAPGEKGCQAPLALVIEFNADGLTPPSFLARKTG